MSKNSEKTNCKISRKYQKAVFLENQAPSHFMYCYFASVSKISWENIMFFKNSYFRQIRLGHILGIVNTHPCAKNRKTLMMKSQENAKKTFIPAYFIFSKIGLRHFLATVVLHLCAKNLKKLISRSREKLLTDKRTDTPVASN